MILIDMEMPESCDDCPLNYDCIWCCVTHQNFWGIPDYDSGKDRLPDCPIIDEIKFEHPAGHEIATREEWDAFFKEQRDAETQ